MMCPLIYWEAEADLGWNQNRLVFTEFNPIADGGGVLPPKLIVLNGNNRLSTPQVYFAYFTSTLMRIQGCMQHWKKCSPLESPAS